MDRPRNPFPEDADASGPYPAKFAKLGLTFDDVLLAAGRVGRGARRGRHQHPPDPAHRAGAPHRVGGDGHRHRGAPGHRHGPRRRHRHRAPQPVGRRPGGRGRQGQALAVRHDRRPRHAAARRARRVGPGDHGQVPHLRRADHRPRRPSRGHPHQPRPPLRRRRRPAHRQRHAAAAARHRLGRHHARRGQGHPLEEPHREAARRRRRRLPPRPHHRQGHQEAHPVPAAPPTTSGAGCGSGPRSAWGPTRSSGPSGSSTPGSTCSWSTPPTATPAPCSTW